MEKCNFYDIHVLRISVLFWVLDQHVSGFLGHTCIIALCFIVGYRPARVWVCRDIHVLRISVLFLVLDQHVFGFIGTYMYYSCVLFWVLDQHMSGFPGTYMY